MYCAWLLFCGVQTASVQPGLTARNRIVLHQRCAVLSGCNISSCVDLSAWEFVPRVREFKLAVFEIFAFPVAPK